MKLIFSGRVFAPANDSSKTHLKLIGEHNLSFSIYGSNFLQNMIAHNFPLFLSAINVGDSLEIGDEQV